MRLSKSTTLAKPLRHALKQMLQNIEDYNHQEEISTTWRFVLSLLLLQLGRKQQQTMVSIST